MKVCEFHLERRNESVRAKAIGMCEDCLNGKPLAWKKSLVPAAWFNHPMLVHFATDCIAQMWDPPNQ